MKKIYIFAPFILTAIIIFVLSHQSDLPSLHILPHQDKLFHLLSYFFLSYFLERIFKYFGMKDILGHAFTAIIIMLFAIGDEFHQYFIPNRIPDPFDLLADYIGMMLAFSFSKTLFKFDKEFYIFFFGKVQ
jgi:VanZ family protein